MILVGAFLWRAVVVEKASPDQWSAVWANFRDSKSPIVLVKDTYSAMVGEKVVKVALTAEQSEKVVYKWVDSWGRTQMSYQKPNNVDKVEEIRLGELDYDIEASLNKYDIYQATKSAETDEDN